MDAQSKLIRLLEENPELLSDFGDFKRVKDIPKERAEFVYTKAMELYEKADYASSRMLLAKLGTVIPGDFRISYGMASCFFKEKDYESAIQCYFAAATIDPHNPEPKYYLSLCYRYLGQKSLELVCLRKCVAISYKHPLYESIYNKAEPELRALEYELQQAVRKELERAVQDGDLEKTLERIVKDREMFR